MQNPLISKAKDFVKRHYVAICTVTVSAALVVLACIFGPKVVESIVSLFNNREEKKEEEKKEAIKEIKKEDEDVAQDMTKKQKTKEKTAPVTAAHKEVETKDKVVAQVGEFSLTESDIEYMVNHLLNETIRDLNEWCKSRVEKDESYYIGSDEFERASMIGDDAKEKMDLLNEQMKKLKTAPENKQEVLKSIDDFTKMLEQRKSEKQEFKAIAKRIIKEDWLVKYQKVREDVGNGRFVYISDISHCTLFLPIDNSFHEYTWDNLEHCLLGGRYKGKEEEVIKLIDNDMAILNSFIKQLGE